VYYGVIDKTLTSILKITTYLVTGIALLDSLRY